MKTDVQHNDGNLDGMASFNCIINLFTFFIVLGSSHVIVYIMITGGLHGR
jgi:hypothetical protein